MKGSLREVGRDYEIWKVQAKRGFSAEGGMKAGKMLPEWEVVGR